MQYFISEILGGGRYSSLARAPGLQRKVAVAFNASVGGHYRHCLDDFPSLLDSAVQGGSAYGNRTRLFDYLANVDNEQVTATYEFDTFTIKRSRLPEKKKVRFHSENER